MPAAALPAVAIIGGGVIGSAIATHLRLGGASVTVIERDTSYAAASSSLSASSIRQQFSQPVNIALSQYGIAFLRDAAAHLSVDGDAPALSLREPGYLYLASPAGADVLRANHRVQRDARVQVALLDPDALQSRFPWLSTDGIALGSLGLDGEGWFDGPALAAAFRGKARSLGAAWVQGDAVAFEHDGPRVSAVRLGDGTRVPCDAVVNAAGPHARAVAAMAGVALPVEARRRCVFVFTCPEALPDCPLVIDTTGVWWRPEGDRFIAGWSPPDDAEEFGLDVDYAIFDEVIWPALAARVPAFERVRGAGAWAGHYEFNTFDHNALLGLHPDVPNLYFANGFSGHGMQQAPGVGRGIAELVLHGAYQTLDLSPLSVARVPTGRPLLERNVI